MININNRIIDSNGNKSTTTIPKDMTESYNVQQKKPDMKKMFSILQFI